MSKVKVKYTVHSVSRSAVQRTVKYGAQEVPATVPCLVVELVSECGGMGHSFTFIGGEAAAAEEMFEPEGSIVVSFSKGE